MHGGLCDCCKCDKTETRRRRKIDATVEALPVIIEAGIEEFLRTAIVDAADAVDYDGEDLADFTIVALEALVYAASVKYIALATSPTWTPAMAENALVRIVRAEAK